MRFYFLAAPHHSDSLQVDLGAAQFLPAVVFIALSLGDAAELARRLEDVFHQRTTAHLVGRDLSGETGGGTEKEREMGRGQKDSERDRKTGRESRETDRWTQNRLFQLRPSPISPSYPSEAWL